MRSGAVWERWRLRRPPLRHPTLRRLWSAPVLTAVVVLAGVVASLGLGGVLVAAQRDSAREQMDRRASLVATAVAGEADRYTDSVLAVAAAVGALDTLTADRFGQVTAPLAHIGLAGATSIVFLVPATDAQIPAVEEFWRGRGVPDLRLQGGGGPPREHVFSVFSVPLDGVSTARYGIDVTLSDPAARALTEARRSGGAVISDPYELLIDRQVPAAQRQQSFILTAPVTGAPDASGNRPFLGWVTLGLRGRDFISATLARTAQNQVDVTLFAPSHAGPPVAVAAHHTARPGGRDLVRSRTVAVADRHWQLEVRAVAAQSPGASPVLPATVTAAGLALVGLLAGLVYVLATRQARAAAQVRTATAELAGAEAAARDQADLLTAILDNIGDGVGVVDEAGEFLLHNPAAKAILGIAEDKGGAEHWQAHYGIFTTDGTAFPTERLPLVRALAGESTEQVEMVIRNEAHPHGITITVSGRPLRTASGRRGAVAVFHDITTEKAVKGELAATADALRAARDDLSAQKSYLDQILDTIGVAVVACDSTGTIVRANRAAHPALRAGHVEVARALSTMDIRRADGTPMPPADVPLLRALSGTVVDDEEVLLTRDGSRRAVVMHAHPLLGPTGSTIGAVDTSYDITTQREREAELHAFAGVVAHDLKAPLTALGGYTEILQDTLADDAASPVVRSALDRMRHGVDRMRRLIDDLLTYATARDAELNQEPVDLQALVAEIVTERTAHLRAGAAARPHATAHPRATGDGRPVPFPDIYTGPLPVVYADRMMVRQLLDNLIGNALKYTLPGQPARIDIAAHHPDGAGDLVHIQVADRGIGIPEDEQPHVFDTFHRSAAHTGYSGTGLGLAICRRVVDRHGGTIAVSDNPGGGTRITVTLPAAAHEPAEAREPVRAATD